jgi:hypothetical protein
LGIFIIISRAFDSRFYDVQPSQFLDDEIASAESHFISLIHYFATHYITILDGVAIDSWYIIKRMLAEFAAAVAVFIQAMDDSPTEDMEIDDGQENEGEEADVVPPSKVQSKINDIIAESYPELISYYQRCVASGHKHFFWTGPPVTIVPRSDASESIVGLLISEGEKMDHPTYPIFITDMTPPLTAPPPPPPATSVAPLPAAPTKRRGSTDGDDLRDKKRRS